MRPSAFDPAPTPLPLRAAVGIALVLLAGVSVSVVEYLDSAKAVEAAPKAAPQVESVPPEFLEPVTILQPQVFPAPQSG
jgi:hypothetical protein